MNTKERLIELFQQKYPRLLEYAVGITGTRERALDVVQTLAVRILELPDEKCIEFGDAYLYSALRNIAIDLYRREKPLRCIPPEDFERYLPANQWDDSLFEIKQLLDECLAGCSDEMRQAFIRHILFGERVADIAVEYRISAVMLRKRISRMKAMIPKELLMMIVFILAIYQIAGHTFAS